MVVSSLWEIVCCGDVTPMDGSIVIMGDSLLLRCFTPMDGSLVIMGDSSLLRCFTLMNGSFIIMGDSSLLRCFIRWMVVSSSWEIFHC